MTTSTVPTTLTSNWPFGFPMWISNGHPKVKANLFQVEILTLVHLIEIKNLRIIFYFSITLYNFSWNISKSYCLPSKCIRSLTNSHQPPYHHGIPTYYDEISIDPWLIFQLPLVYSSHSSQNELINTWVKACNLYIKILHGFSLLLNSKVSKKLNSPLLVLDIFSLPRLLTPNQSGHHTVILQTLSDSSALGPLYTFFSFAQKDTPPDTLKAPSIIFISLFKCPIF